MIYCLLRKIYRQPLKKNHISHNKAKVSSSRPRQRATPWVVGQAKTWVSRARPKNLASRPRPRLTSVTSLNAAALLSSRFADLNARFLLDWIAAAVCRVLGDVLRWRADHGDQRHAEVHSQAVNVEEAEERQRRKDHSTRRKLYSDTHIRPVLFGCLGGVTASDLRSSGRGFDSRSGRHQTT